MATARMGQNRCRRSSQLSRGQAGTLSGYGGGGDIHLMIGESGPPRYYIDDVVFVGEFGVTIRYRRNQELRGGSGIVTLRDNGNGVLVAVRDIILERHPTRTAAVEQRPRPAAPPLLHPRHVRKESSLSG